MNAPTRYSAALNLISRYRIVAIDPLDRQTAAAVAQELKNLEQERSLSRWRHASGVTYWTRPATRPLSNSSLARAYGLLAYCPPTGTRKLLAIGETKRLFQSIGGGNTASGYYLDRSTDAPGLGLLRVDTGSRVSRLVTASTRNIDQLRRAHEVRKFVDSGGFEITWLVPTKTKRRRLEQSLQHLSASGVRFNVVVIPELLGLLAPLPTR